MKQAQASEPATRALIEKPPLAVVARVDERPKADAPETAASREARIRVAAYALYEARGRVPGHDVEDWLVAEARLAAEATAASPQAGPTNH